MTATPTSPPEPAPEPLSIPEIMGSTPPALPPIPAEETQ